MTAAPRRLLAPALVALGLLGAAGPATAATAAAPAAVPVAGAGTSATAPAAPATGCSLVPVLASDHAERTDFVLRNAGTKACRTPAAPVVRLAEDGRRVPVRVAYQDAAQARTVPPGGLATFSTSVLGRRCAPTDTVSVALESGRAVFSDAAVRVCRGGRLAVTGFRVVMPLR